MRKPIRRAVLQLLSASGFSRLVRDSAWRRERLLILCYHGSSQDDEHLWRPALYMQPQLLEQRIEILKRGKYNVLPLGEAVRRMYANDLPPRSVAITFDDGTYDFYKQAYPILKRAGLPVTVYQTTYYSEHAYPIFNLVCSYLMWKRRGEVLDRGRELGLDPAMDLRTEASRYAVVQALEARAEKENLTGQQKNDLAARLAGMMGVDYGAFCARRILQLMTPQEVAQLAKEGVDIQLHTHRHRMPKDEELFREEIRDNRESLHRVGVSGTTHFCYPSGVHDRCFIPWLQREGVISATTCDTGLASVRSEALLLPRLVDTTGRSALEFESWLTGVGDLLAMRRAATQRYIPPED